MTQEWSFAVSCERHGWVFWSGHNIILRAQISISQSMFTKQMISIKASKALIPTGALGEQDPSQQPYWDVAQGSDQTEPLPDWQSNFSAALHLICDIYGEVHQFFCGGKHIYFTCLRSTEVQNTRWCSSRQAAITHCQGCSSDGGRFHWSDPCSSSSLCAGLCYFLAQ